MAAHSLPCRGWYAGIAGCILAVALLAENPEPAARARSLERSLMAPCCWSETLAEHRSEVALQMKKEIAALIAQGRSNREILDLFKARYGTRILAEPEGATRAWLDVVPVVVFTLGLAAVLWIVHRWSHRLSHTIG